MKVIHFQVRGRDYYVNSDKLIEIRRGVTTVIRWQVTSTLCECEEVDDGKIKLLDDSWVGLE